MVRATSSHSYISASWLAYFSRMHREHVLLWRESEGGSPASTARIMARRHEDERAGLVAVPGRYQLTRLPGGFGVDPLVRRRDYLRCSHCDLPWMPCPAMLSAFSPPRG